jgi:hypothetical protein
MGLRESRTKISGRTDAGGSTVGRGSSRKEVIAMTLSRKDVAAGALTTLAVLAFLATHEGWGVPLVGDSHRWAAGAIFLVGSLTCGFGSPATGAWKTLFATLGVAALVLAALAVATGSLTPLSLLVLDLVALWALATLRHAQRLPLTS